MGRARHVAGMREKYGLNKNKRLIGKHRCRWEDNIKMDLKETGWEAVNRIQCYG
jgi:hypothetical protein